MSNIHFYYSESTSMNRLEYSLREFGKMLVNRENSLERIEYCLREQLEDWKQERTRYRNATTTIVPVPEVGMLVVLDRPEGRVLFTLTNKKWWWLWDSRLIKGYLLAQKYKLRNPLSALWQVSSQN